jgi:peptidyl-tRNA hydrolase, PTH1 family
MWLLVGLGNPGPKYAHNRHNVGFMAANEIVRRHGLPAWRKRFHSEVSEGMIGDEKVLVLKPMTYMNESGRAVGEAMRFHSLTPEDIIVFHDELDLVPGKVRTKIGGGAAGNNGLRSISAHIGPDYARVRIGIGHPGHKEAVLHHVLNDFSKVERDFVPEMLEAIAEALPHLLKGEEGSFQNKIHLAVHPPEERAEKKEQT